ncbi:MAG: glycosyltransferase family 4 protein [Solirubrobacteraceae bacterium]|nr:glycosyltransferase family 4 protein [Solirubrobacteraceae bacterium]
MRILLVNNFSYVTGGVDRHCLDLAALLRDAGHEVAFLATDASHRVATDGAFVPLLVTNETRDGLPLLESARVATRATWNRTAYAAARRLIDDFAPDVVHLHKLYPHLSCAPVIAARDAGVPIVQTAHDYEFLSANPFDHTGATVDHAQTRLRFRALNTVLFEIRKLRHVPLVDAWVTVSQAMADVYASHGIAARPVPNFTLVPTGPAPRFEARSGALYAGRLTVDKGVDDIISLARAVPELDIRVAGFGPLAHRVSRAASRIPNLTYLGFLSLEGVQEELRHSRVCLMPSRWEEPGPLVALEAMAAGTPIVAYDHGGLAEYVRNAHAGRVIGTEPMALAANTAFLCTDVEEWTKMSANAMAAIHDTHSPDAYLREILAVYAGVTGRPAPAHGSRLSRAVRAA